VTQAATDAQSSQEKQAQSARKAGRGLLSILGAKVYFIVTGYAVQLLLPRLLGSPETFGLFSSAMNVVSILNMVLITASMQTVSKHISEDLEHADATLRQGLLLQFGLGALIGGGLWCLSPLLTEHVLLDPALTPLLKTASIVVFSYGPYAALIGSLNGRQLFQRQTALDVTYNTMRSVGIVGAAALGLGALGAIQGFSLAAVLVLLVALWVVGTGKPGRSIPWKRWLLFMAPLWLYQLCLNLAFQVDLSVLKGSVAALSQDAGMSAVAAADTASRLAGFYRAAQTFAFVPYQLIMSVTLVVFPMISQAVTLGDHEATRRYLRTAMRFSLIVLLAIAAPVSGAASGVMRVAYSDVYLGGSDALAILSLGMVCFALFAVASTALSGAGSPGLPAAIAVVMVALIIGCNMLFIRWAGVGPNTLAALATGTSVGMAFGLCAIGVASKLRFGTFIAPLSGLRVVLSAGIGWLVAHQLPTTSALLALGALCAGGLSFVVALLVTRELGAADMDVLRKIVRR
jgi:stage V sporulation protein B